MTRVGLVLGAGGVIGHAYHGAVLAALHDAAGWDARDAEIVVGTSAGSIDASLLRAGLSPRDVAAGAADEPLSDEGARLLAHAPRRPSMNAPRRTRSPSRWHPSSTGRLLEAARRPWQARLGTIAAAALPEGAMPTDRIVAGIDPLFGEAWPDRALWICAVRLDDGRRVVFGRDGAPVARVAAAVAASCAIPAWFAPVEIGGTRYVDGGAYSVSNLDVLAGCGLDVVIVSSPMSTLRTALRTSLDGAARAAIHLRLAQESARVRGRGTRVIALEPDSTQLEVMGRITEAMDPRGQAAVVHRVRASMAVRLRHMGVADILQAA